MINKKILFLGIFTTLLLFITPFAIANNPKINKRSEVIENQNVIPLDNYGEIITLIYGACDDVQINRIGLMCDIEFYADSGITSLEIDGRRKPWENFHMINIDYIHAYRFIGFIIPTAPIIEVYGIALGNIEWY